MYNKHPKGCNCGCNKHYPIALAGDKQIIADIWDKGAQGINDTLLQRYAGGYEKAIKQVFTNGWQYPELENDLRINASRVATYKTYELSRRLDDLRASGISREEYEKQANALLQMYNGFQKTEYNTMVARARTAKQYERFKTESDLYPNIEWLHTRSASPRELHLTYVGIILPIGHSFWNENQPGNLYNCKCDWRTTDKPATHEPINTIAPAPGLEGNPAETRQLFTEKHPYFERNSNAPAWIEDKALLNVPDKTAFVAVETMGGNSFFEHLLVDKTEEAVENRLIASLLADNGYNNLRLLPQINEGEKALRKRYFGAAWAAKHPTFNPDAINGSTLLEFKKAKRRNMSMRVKEAAKKSDVVFIQTSEPLTDDYITNFVKRQFEMPDRINMNELIIYNNGKLQVFRRK